jgi:zinc/manganese transport system substrate-binding protein
MGDRRASGTPILIVRQLRRHVMRTKPNSIHQLARAALCAALAGAYAGVRADLNVVATTPDLASIAQEVGGSKVKVSAIVVGARDPHRIEAKPSYMSRASQADLWLAVGLDLETAYERLILEGARNAKIRPGGPGHVYVSQWVKVRDVPTGPVTRAHGDLHPHGNPHIWLDPYNGRLIAEKLAEKMGSLDKANVGYYKDRADAFVKRLDRAMFGAAADRFGGQLWQWDNENKLVPNLTEKGALGDLGGWAGAMRRHWGASILTHHRSWNYFAYRFGLKVVGELEPKPGLDPTPGHLAAVVRKAKETGAKLILQEPYYSRRNADFVARQTGSAVVVAPGNVTHEPAAKDYISLFDVIVGKVSAALGK